MCIMQKGKHIGRVGQQDPGEFPEDVKSCLHQAVSYYEENLTLMYELNDVAAQGRACGNLGNTHYLLGDFGQAIHYHEMRLAIARQFGDKAAERRANSNLGNSHIFLGQFESAAQHYKRTLVLAQELGDKAVEAQACYSLGNTYTLLRDYQAAIEHHLRHLLIAQQLQDRVGEGRACWSLGNAHAALQNHERALYFASKHLEISNELGDTMGQATAKMNIADLRKVLGLPQDDQSPEDDVFVHSPDSNSPVLNGGEDVTTHLPVGTTSARAHLRCNRVRRESMEQLNLIKLTPDGKQRSTSQTSVLSAINPAPSTKQEDEESFFDLLSRFQSKRMDDQRCSLQINENKENRNAINLPSMASDSAASNTNHNNNEIVNGATDRPDELLDMIVGMQSKRMDEQRVALPHLPGLQQKSLQRLADSGANAPDDPFLEMLMRSQSSRLEEQRSALPSVDVDTESEHPIQCQGTPSVSGATVPDEDFFSLIMRFQSGRMEDQRATVPPAESRLSNGTASSGATNTVVTTNNKNKKK